VCVCVIVSVSVSVYDADLERKHHTVEDFTARKCALIKFKHAYGRVRERERETEMRALEHGIELRYIIANQHKQ